MAKIKCKTSFLSRTKKKTELIVPTSPFTSGFAFKSDSGRDERDREVPPSSPGMHLRGKRTLEGFRASGTQSREARVLVPSVFSEQ